MFGVRRLLPAHNLGDRPIGGGMREHQLDLALDCRLLGHLGVVDEGAALVAAGRDITSSHVLQTLLKDNIYMIKLWFGGIRLPMMVVFPHPFWPRIRVRGEKN